MKLINLILLLLPLTGFSQVDSIVFGDSKIIGERLYVKKRPEPKLYKLQPDTLPATTGGITTQSLNYYGGSRWYDNWSTELVKGQVETPINVMDSGMKVEVVETRDTIYKCPLSYGSVTYFTSTGEVEKSKNLTGCKLDEIVTTRRYKLYIINEYGQKEYLSMELTKTK